MVGAIPARHREAVAPARGTATSPWRAARRTWRRGDDEWFDTNYHYLVPELGRGHGGFTADTGQQVAELTEALAPGPHRADRPGRQVHLPHCSPSRHRALPAGFEPLTLLDRLLPCTPRSSPTTADRAPGAEPTQLRHLGVKLDEPALVQDRTTAEPT
ncbi:hypothetical protein GCM10017687_63400 [Streptomyces echinatus]